MRPQPRHIVGGLEEYKQHLRKACGDRTTDERFEQSWSAIEEFLLEWAADDSLRHTLEEQLQSFRSKIAALDLPADLTERLGLGTPDEAVERLTAGVQADFVQFLTQLGKTRLWHTRHTDSTPGKIKVRLLLDTFANVGINLE